MVQPSSVENPAFPVPSSFVELRSIEQSSSHFFSIFGYLVKEVATDKTVSVIAKLAIVILSGCTVMMTPLWVHLGIAAGVVVLCTEKGATMATALFKNALQEGKSLIKEFSEKNIVAASISGIAIACFCHLAIIGKCALCTPICMSVGVLTVSVAYGDEVNLEIMAASLIASAIAVGVHGILLAAAASNPIITTALAITSILILAQPSKVAPSVVGPLKPENLIKPESSIQNAKSIASLMAENPNISPVVDLFPLYPQPLYFYPDWRQRVSSADWKKSISSLKITTLRLIDDGKDDGKYVLSGDELIPVTEIQGTLLSGTPEYIRFSSALAADQKRRNIRAQEVDAAYQAEQAKERSKRAAPESKKELSDKDFIPLDIPQKDDEAEAKAVAQEKIQKLIASLD